MVLHLAFVTDRGYLPWCATAIRSCAETQPDSRVHLHVVHDQTLTATDQDALRATAGGHPLTVHGVDPAAVGHLPGVDRFGHVVWLRFLLPDLLPDVERVLYLDADTLVVDDLTELADLDLGGAPLAAVANVSTPSDRARIHSMGMAEGAAYLNSGVLLLDLQRLRGEGLMARVARMTGEQAGRIRWPDQDVLNLMFEGRWYPLHPRFNAQNSLFEWAGRAEQVFGGDRRREAIERPAILHFEGAYLCKPWHALSVHPWRDRYRAVWGRTPWADVGLEDDTWVTRVIGHLPPRWQLPVYEQVVRRRTGLRPSIPSMIRRTRQRAALESSESSSPSRPDPEAP